MAILRVQKPRKSPASNFGTSPRVLSEHPDILIQEVIRRIAVESFDVVREGIEQRVSSGKSLQAFISLRSNVDHGLQTVSMPSFAFAVIDMLVAKRFCQAWTGTRMQMIRSSCCWTME